MFFQLREMFGLPDIANLLTYITVRAAFAGITSFLFCIMFGKPLIARLHQLRIKESTGSSDSQILNKLHMEKKHTPTMGGLLIVGAMLLSCFLWTNWNFYSYSMMALIAGLGMIGFCDDYIKLKNKGKVTLSAKMKTMYMLLLIVPICYLMWVQDKRTFVYFPFFKDYTLDLQAFYVWWAVLVVYSVSNAVNLTDGLDGLATGSSLMVGGAFVVLAYVAGHADMRDYLMIPGVVGCGEITIVCASLCGACLGFLWYNCHPAEIFMGDTGSLPLGGVIGYAAVIIKQEVLLILVGGIFVIEAVSVIIQVLYFKKTSKRWFRCAPIHHHFEFGGLPESKIVMRFWIIGIVLAVAALATLKLR